MVDHDSSRMFRVHLHIILLVDGEFTQLYTIINCHVNLPLTKKLRQKEKLITL